MKLPNEFIEKYTNLFGDEAAAFFASLQEDVVEKGFRLNPLKNQFENVSYSLAEPVPYVPTGYYGNVSGKSLEHQTGYVYSQDLSAMYVAEVLDIEPGDRVLDLCAAPGGKSTQLAGKLNDTGLLVSNEINLKRAKILAENMERTGAKNVVVLNENPANLAKHLPGYFDKIIVDAPCSGEGMFRKDHNAIDYWHQDYPAECALRQRDILQDAVKLLAPGGQLVYSTCTFAPEEDEQIIDWLVTSYPDFEILPIEKYPGMDQGIPAVTQDQNLELEKTVRLMPHHFKGEGHYIAKLQDTRTKTSDVVKSPKVKKKKNKKQQDKTVLSKEEYQLWQAFQSEVVPALAYAQQDLKVYGSYLYYYSKNWFSLDQLKFVRPGLLLGTFKKNRFEPSYSLAVALNPTTECAKTITITREEWATYVSGNVINVSRDLPNGWYLLECEGKAVSFTKVVQGVAKNFFPKGLRFNV
ncbi:RsmB/NOP family class I SAM-dependent RNA methyltransferase [Ligilactobacillus ceti]|uniref:23S rRNA m(5)C methyltransferase n=1 Tax=Ligilactobacillus ceti DSM 22408 TaxID=1122146 RepID=A0A0R2KH21_9LACO|nr:RsmF rRNA methyltransferase first C-terminal domain-containing protein [Ligilactobacillus ceti]KRN88655.1 23S rRNA m(5)C methyltransferase [Ligilactobacillus ceti DSM 22408]